MSNEKKTEQAPESGDPFAQSETEPEAARTSGARKAAPDDGASAADAAPHEAGSPDARIRELEERLQRAVAEQENLRKRMEREKEDIAKYAIANFAREVLGIADNIQRAINAVPRDAAQRDTALKTFLDGIEVTERELHKAMERQGIARLDPEGEKFDPNFHQAMFEIPTADKPSGFVMQVVQPGYTLGDRVLRPAMVGVSKAAPAASGANENNPQAGAQNGAASDVGKQQEPAGEAQPRDASGDQGQQGSAAQREPETASQEAAPARGTSRLNEPVINPDTEKAFGTGEAARRKS